MRLALLLALLTVSPAPRPVTAPRPALSDWEVKTWSVTPCAFCDEPLDPFKLDDGEYTWNYRPVLSHGKCARKRKLK